MLNELKINDKNYELHFGIDFIREMDKRYGIDTNGLHFGQGIQSAIFYLSMGNPVVLSDIILSATHTLKSIPSKNDIEEWLCSLDIDVLDKLFDDFLECLEESPLTRTQVMRIRKAAQE